MTLSVIIPTYRRESVLVETLDRLSGLRPGPAEVLVVDQTERHEAEVEARLRDMDVAGAVRWLRLNRPSVTAAMNLGLIEAKGDIVLFLDDDVIPEPELFAAHLEAHCGNEDTLVAGRVIQPWQEGLDFSGVTEFHFATRVRREVEEFIGCNFSMPRPAALRIGGFDENFVRVAYRFEAEFAHRWRAGGRRIVFEPRACLHHLKTASGGTRSYGNHLTTTRPDHAVGEYYWLFRTQPARAAISGSLKRFACAIVNRHHLRRPWWIPATLLAELRGLFWAARLAWRGPRLIEAERVARSGSLISRHA